jgi:hypothetical protein
MSIFVYKTKESLGAPSTLQTWGSSFLLVGPLAFRALASQHFIHKIRKKKKKKEKRKTLMNQGP